MFNCIQLITVVIWRWFDGPGSHRYLYQYTMNTSLYHFLITLFINFESMKNNTPGEAMKIKRNKTNWMNGDNKLWPINKPSNHSNGLKLDCPVGYLLCLRLIVQRKTSPKHIWPNDNENVSIVIISSWSNISRDLLPLSLVLISFFFSKE